MKKKIIFCLVLFSFILGSFSSPVWPLSKQSSPDLPQSNMFGPRISVGNGYIYDWHRGIDIPTPFGIL